MPAAAKTAAVALIAVLAGMLAWDLLRSTAPPVVESSASPTVTPRVSSTPSTAIDISAQAMKNKLYSAGKVPAVRCRPPTSALGSKAALLAHGRVLVDCMHRAWAPLVARGDVFLEPPKLDAYKNVGETSTVCGAPPPDSDAFYCPSEGMIFFEWELYLPDPDDEPEWSLADFQYMLAHEYGHHLQSAVGIMAAYDVNHEASSAAVKLEDERRLELQAGCLGAAFLGANQRTLRLTDAWRELFEYQVRESGDDNAPKLPRDHGSRKSHTYWTLRAFESANPASCNTFTAPPNQVS